MKRGENGKNGKNGWTVENSLKQLTVENCWKQQKKMVKHGQERFKWFKTDLAKGLYGF